MKHAKTKLDEYSSGNRSTGRFVRGSRNNDLFKAACAMRGRGESMEFATQKLFDLSAKCSPPLHHDEVLEFITNVWNRYSSQE